MKIKKVLTEMVFVQFPCASCGVQFCMPEDLLDRRKEDKGNIYCPNGHSMSYRTSRSDQLAEALSKTRQQLAEKDDEIRNIEARAKREREAAKREQDAAKRMRRRVQNGVCPHCNRSFASLARHMKTKHCEAIQ